MQDQAGCESYSYDYLGRATKTTRVTDGKKFEETYSYDLLDRLTQTVYPDGGKIAYDYKGDALEGGPLLQRVSSAPTGGVDYAREIVYDARDQMKSMDVGQPAGGSPVLRMTHTYDPDTFRLTQTQALPVATAGPKYFDRSYMYWRPTGDVMDIVDNRPNTSNNRHFEYDKLSRLTKANGPYGAGGAQIDLSYDYDPTGNLRFMDKSTSPPALGRELVYDSSSPQPHAVNEIREGATSTFLTYDPNGNPLTKGSQSFTWDAENRLTSLTGLPNNGTQSNLYDFSGNRVKKTVTDSSGTRIVLYVGGDFEWEATASASTRHVFAGGMRVA
ncbi:MAG: hypothetical protein ACREDF_05545, partial [Thermoplasmata archaeon]